MSCSTGAAGPLAEGPRTCRGPGWSSRPRRMIPRPAPSSASPRGRRWPRWRPSPPIRPRRSCFGWWPGWGSIGWQPSWTSAPGRSACSPTAACAGWPSGWARTGSEGWCNAMGADDASSADMRRPPANPDADPLALDDETLERLLTGELSPTQAPPGYAEVAALLAATAAPPTPDELAGQAAALAELRAATRPQRAVVGLRRAAPPPRRRRVGLLAVALVGALAMGGVAAAAGNVPAPLRDAARRIMATVDGAEPA